MEPKTPSVADLAAELEKVKSELESVKAERDQFQPFKEYPVFETASDVIAFHGEAHLREIAEDRLARADAEARKRGRPPQWEGDRQGWERRVAEVVAEIAEETVGAKSKWVEDPGKATPQRTMKMVKPDGNMVQIPVEPQINNGAGSISDPIERYKRKGFKLATPVRCALRDCWEPAEVSGGKLVFSGYCTEAHRQRKEGAVRRRSDGGEITMAGAAQY